jgi:hypothetical protein
MISGLNNDDYVHDSYGNDCDDIDDQDDDDNDDS